MVRRSFVISKIKDIVPWTYVINDLNGEEIIGTFYEKDKSVAKVNNIDTTAFLSKTKYDTGKSDLEKRISDTDKKIPDNCGLVKKQIIMLKLLK